MDKLCIQRIIILRGRCIIFTVLGIAFLNASLSSQVSIIISLQNQFLFWYHHSANWKGFLLCYHCFILLVHGIDLNVYIIIVCIIIHSLATIIDLHEKKFWAYRCAVCYPWYITYRLHIHCIVVWGTGCRWGKTNGLNMYTRAAAVVGRMGIQFRPGNPEFFRGHLICFQKIIGFSSLL